MSSHYTPTKAGILSLMQSCAVALGRYNIRANAILPGTIATDINKEDLSDEVKREGMIKRTCLGRLGSKSPFTRSNVGSRIDMTTSTGGYSWASCISCERPRQICYGRIAACGRRSIRKLAMNALSS